MVYGTMTFGQKLKRLIKARGSSQQAVADLIGKQQSNISKYIKGEYEPGLSDAWKIARFLGVTLDYLLDDDEERDIADLAFEESCRLLIRQMGWEKALLKLADVEEVEIKRGSIHQIEQPSRVTGTVLTKADLSRKEP